MANVLASVAQFETKVRAERILAGQAAACTTGKVWVVAKPAAMSAYPKRRSGQSNNFTSKAKESVRLPAWSGCPVRRSTLLLDGDATCAMFEP